MSLSFVFVAGLAAIGAYLISAGLPWPFDYLLALALCIVIGVILARR